MADITLTELDEDDDELARQASVRPQAAGRSALKDYELGSELGSGSFATCWSARHRRTGQEVAIKIIEVRPGQGQQQMAEIEHMVKVGRHPSILEVRDAGLEDAHIYLVSPLCQWSLEERRQQPFDARQWCAWLLQAAEALSLLHRCQIVHCDVKPPNLLLDRHDRLLLADLGQARPLADPRPRMGSYFYMPPEQAEGNSPQASWDIYALAASFYCAWTGYAPRSRSFQLAGDDHQQRLALYRRELPLAPLLPSASIPERYWPLLRRMLDLDPRRRPVSMEEVAHALRRLEGTRPWPRWRSGRTALATVSLLLGLGLLSQVVGDLLLPELALWFSLSLAVLLRVSLLAASAGAVAGAALLAWEFQRNR